jgi:hypothetical protein
MKKFPFKLLAVIPPLILGLLVWKYGLNILFWDEWDISGLDSVAQNLGTLTWGNMFAQHNESRNFFPRLLSAYFSRFTSWNPVYGMTASILLACLTSFNIYYLSKITLNSTWSTWAKRLILLALANLLIFSPMQWENWLWGLQCITFVSIAVITSALAIIFSQNSLSIKFFSSLLLAIFATFSFANGMISWIVIFPALILVARKNKGSLTLMTAGWLFSSVLAFAVYFHNYHRPVNNPGFFDAFTQPINALLYFLAFLGSPLGVIDLVSSQIIGFCILLLIALVCLYLIKINRSQKLLFQVFPWLCIVSYALGSAILTTTGRLGLGMETSLSSRYITFSTYGIVGLIYLLAILAEDLKPHLDIQGSRYLKTLKRIITISMVGFLLLYPANFTSGVNAMVVNHKNKLYAKACLSMMYFVKDEECFQQYIYPDPKSLADRVVELDRLGIIQPPLIASNTMQGITSPSIFETIKYGQFDTITKGENNTYIATGWSILPQYRIAAHAVILAYQTKNNLDHPFTLVQPQIERLDVAAELGDSKYQNSGWSKTFSQELIPKDAVAVSAWAYDSRVGRAYKLQITHLVNSFK